MTTLILTAFLFLTPPSATVIKDDVIRSLHDAEQAMRDAGLNADVLHFEHFEADTVADKLEFIETKLSVTPEDENDPPYNFSIWMPNRLLVDNFILISHPGELTGEIVLHAFEILRSM